MKKDQTVQINRLKLLLAFAVLAGFILFYVLLPSPSGKELAIVTLARNAIPSAVVVVAAFIALYLLLHTAGIPTGSAGATEFNVQELAGAIVDRMKEERAFDTGLLEFHETFRNVDWKRQLLEAREHIDIIVYYFDSWVNTNFNELVAFFQRPKTTMRVFVADPRNGPILDEIHRLFPEYSKEVLAEKVMRTGERIREAAKNAGATPERVQFLLVPHLLAYSAQVIDNRRLVLSIFETSRKLKIDSPSFIIDIGRNRHLEDFVKKEIAGLLETAQKV